MKRKVIICGQALADEAMNLLAENNIEPILVAPYTPSSEIAATLKKEGADAILVRMGDVTEEVVNASPTLKVITKHGVGVNTIDIEAATKKNIPVMITPGANTRSVAEHALAAMLTLVKSLPRLNTNIHEGMWEKTTFKGTELTGKSLGIVGYGSIGRDLLELVKPFNMKIYAYDPALKPGTVPGQVDDINELYKNCDVISLHCPLLDSTRGMIGKEQLTMMKPTAVLINTARGGLIKEDDLAWALENGEIAGAALDSFEVEPPELSTPLWKAPNTIMTPHVAAVTKEALRNMGVQAVTNIITVLDQKPIDPACVVNKSVL